MYVPPYFEPDDESVRQLLIGHGAADLITVTADGLRATMLPFVYLAADDESGRERLVGHVARKNDHWRHAAIGEALAIVRGPDAYITPAWYATKREHGRVVPTWNYITAHIYGELVVHDDAAWVEQNVRLLTAKHEALREPAWAVDDAPPAYIAGQLRAIVGVELLIGRIEAKFKLSQNRSAGDIEGVVAGLLAEGDEQMSAAVAGAVPVRTKR